MKQALSLAALPWVTHLALIVLGIGLGSCLDTAPAWDMADRYPPLAEAPAWAQPFLHWDAHHYARMSAEGYALRTSVMMPVLPVTAGVLAGWTGLPVWVPGLIVCNLAGGVGFLLMARLALRFFETGQARQVVWSLALFPTSFYLHCFYTEPLFLALTLGCILSGMADRPLPAGLLAAAAALTRNLGIGLELFLLALFLPPLKQFAFKPLPGLALACAPLALGAFCLFEHVLFGDALAFIHQQQAQWGRSYHPLWQGLADTVSLLQARHGGLSKANAYLWLNVMLVLWALAGIGVAVRNARTSADWGLLAYSSFLLVVPLLSGSAQDPLLSLSRFILVIPTTHLAQGYIPRLWYPVWALASGAGLVLAMALFSRGWWIA